MTTLAQPHHFIDFAGDGRNECPHCGRVVAADEPVVVSARNPNARWLPADCYEIVWADEIARVHQVPFDRAAYADANEPFDSDDVENIVPDEAGGVDE